jgi:hypothetical protein
MTYESQPEAVPAEDPGGPSATAGNVQHRSGVTVAVPRSGCQQAATGHAEPRQSISVRHGRCRIEAAFCLPAVGAHMGELRSAAWTAVAPSPRRYRERAAELPPPGSGTGRRGPGICVAGASAARPRAQCVAHLRGRPGAWTATATGRLLDAHRGY